MLSIAGLLLLLSCQSQTSTLDQAIDQQADSVNTIQSKSILTFDTSINVIHIFVALCDNQYQGIVPVPPRIGNGQDPFHNLYWGAGYGIKTYFKKSSEWEIIKEAKPDSMILERVLFKHRTENYYLIADAYNGKHIKKATEDFLESSSGLLKDTVQIKDKTLGIAGNSKLVAYIGHDGLMDFFLPNTYQNTDGKERDIIILACYSKDYFEPYIRAAKANPLVWTTGLMAPEAYTIHDAISGYIRGESNENIRLRAAKAYSKYQKCSVNAARNLLVTD